MRIVIDLQGAQSESRFRGIGRYSLALALGVARNAGPHEIWLLLNASLRDSIAPLRLAFAGLVPPERIRLFDLAGPCAEIAPEHGASARASELLREYVIAQLAPDAVLVTSLFEGFVDDAVVSVGAFAPGHSTAVVLYDLIPFLNPAAYLGTDTQRDYYQRKIASLRAAGLLLSISDYSREEALAALALPPDRVVAISTAVSDCFQPGAPDSIRLAAMHARLGLTGEFLMYAPGGFDSRKNVDGLITAYAALPRELRARYQLVVASKLHENDRATLERHARSVGVSGAELILTGYLSDDDLITLYRACALFVFPSKHEGFGLPALEAMACGAIVIGANSTSVPEVIGCEDAMFDPADPAAITRTIVSVLTDPARQQRLREHGARQAKAFSWDHTAQRALRAIEAHHAAAPLALSPAPRRPRVAFVCPMPPERTGVADYGVRILPTLLPFADVTVVVQQEQVSMPPALAHLPVHDSAWLRAHAHEFDHLIYQFGNSPFHSHMIDLLAEHPGVVVLHDFFLSSMLSYEQMSGHAPGLWSRALFHSHGYAPLATIETAAGWEQAKDDYPSNLEILQNASHVIVHSDYARALARQWIAPEAGADWSAAQLPRATPAVNDRAAARAALGIAADAFVVCNFGFVAPTKHCMALLQAWLASSLHGKPECELVFVGANHGGDYGQQMSATIAAANSGKRIRISGWTTDDDYFRYLQAADVGVQLRTSSRGETSGTVLDCMIYGLPTVINANGAMAEFPHDAVWMLPDLFTQQQLVEALEGLYRDSARRTELRAQALRLMATRNSPERCGRMYQDALARDLSKGALGRPALYTRLLESAPDDAMLQALARAISRAPDPLQPRQLLVDVSNIVRHDHLSGIERVVRNQLLELLRLRHSGYRVEPVYLSSEDGRSVYRYARAYGARLIGLAQVPGADLPVDIQTGDHFYCADHAPDLVMEAARAGIYASWRAHGVQLSFLIHDLLPVLRPEFFPVGADLTHGAYLACLAGEADRLICISAAVRDDLALWLEQNGGGLPRLAVLHHGADLTAAPTVDTDAAIGAQDRALVTQIAASPSFLMVGTIEPRKGHLEAIAAFDQLWAQGADAHLVIVGREGWTGLADAERRTIPATVARLQSHPELGRRLHWLNGAGDSLLTELYRVSACLLYPSEGEGFGLPLIEAASHGLPLIARDLPVFREVAGEHAWYFSDALAPAIEAWLAAHARQQHPRPDGLRSMTWKDNVQQLLLLLAQHAGDSAGQTYGQGPTAHS